MKTNKILALGLLAMGTVSLTGCSDSFLEEENPSGDPIEQYYKTEAHLQESVVAAYDPLHWPDWGNGSYSPLNISSDIMGDDLNPGGATASDMLNWQLMANYKADANNTMAALWTDEYSGVKRCNDLIKYVDDALAANIAGITPENTNPYKAQARVLRAYYYMNLWKFFGNVPYFDKNIDGQYAYPQVKADTLYNNVITDLEDVIAQDILPMKAAAGNEGRVTKAFAYMVYAEMVMYQKDETRYPKALAYMQEIINSGSYALLADYKALWDEGNEWCSESIFEINYNDDNHSRGWNTPLAVGGTVLPRLMGPREWAVGVDGVDTGWGFGTVNPATVALFGASDTRKDATAWDVKAAAVANGIDPAKAYKPAWGDTGYFLYKYLPRTANNKDAGWDVDLNFNNNYRVYRYSEVLLNAAELLLRTGGDAATAAKYVNMVRKRAGISELGAVTIDNVLNERHLEFVGEGKRYWDLVRSGKAAEVLVANSAFNRTNSWTENKKYLPIPQAELSADPNLVQNNY
ncbi:MAG: RagB/SusD family nutrient uptake outer membrane protein [Prevotella sp.]|nr:RagB/SusD family nutrient uptake outer membrane protein [Prevotella sp.]